MYTKTQQEALSRAASILLSLNAFKGDILARKHEGKLFSGLNASEKAQIVSQATCMYVADHMKNDGLTSNKELVGKHQNLYYVKYQNVQSLTEIAEEQYRKKEREAMYILLASLSDPNVKEIQLMLSIQGIEPSDTVETVVLKLLEQQEIPEKAEA